MPRRPAVHVRPIPTLILGAFAGFMVGLTSVGAGSIVVVGLLMFHPGLVASALVGTDLMQAIPMVGSAAAGHLLFGDFSIAVAASLLVGAIPGAFIGAHISTRAPGGIIRRILAVLLLGSSMKLLGFSNEVTLLTAAAALVLGSLFWIAIRRRAKASRRRAVARAKAGEPGAGASPLAEPTSTPDASEDRDGVVPDVDDDALLEPVGAAPGERRGSRRAAVPPPRGRTRGRRGPGPRAWGPRR